MSYLDFEPLRDPIVLSILGVVCVAFGIAFLRLSHRRRKSQHEVEELRARIDRAEERTKDQSRLNARLRLEQGTVSSLALSLPSLVRELNQADLDPRRVPGLIMQLAASIFQPAQILFYKPTISESDPRKTELRLIKHQGLTEIPPKLRSVPFGQGKVGWVASHRLDMLKDDWLNPMRTEGQPIEDNHPLLEPDIIGPLMHHNLENEEQVLGVLCIGSPGVALRDEKLMFQLVSNLGSLAMVNAVYRSKFIEQANHDGLTGLLNKRYFMQHLPPLVFQADREARPMALFLFDIDHFKHYNDTNGHPAGDELLRKLAGLLRGNLRPGDWCCRYGGEEFIVAMPNADGNAAMHAAERIRRAIEEFPFEHQDKQPTGNMTISGGVAVLPKDGISIEELTSHADQALYESKRNGRNRVTRYRGLEIGDVEDEIDFPAQSQQGFQAEG
jgi:diguanylate cyclase (GGDEF)-like protein